MPLTKEEKLKRLQEREKTYLRFPAARLDWFTRDSEAGVIVRLDKGDYRYLQILQKGNWGQDANEHFKSMFIPLDNIHELGPFIHALVCRYNALVEEANSIAERSQPKRLLSMESPLKS